MRLLSIFVLFSVIPIGYAATPADRPNVLIIVSDDMGYTDLGAFGGDDIPTPHLDDLAMKGIRLTSFHVAPSCAPSRAMLMSGTGNHEAGLGTQLAIPAFIGVRGFERYVQDRVALLPEVMSAAGYDTFFSGKWHLGHADPLDSSLPRNKGFDRDFALLTGADSHYASVYTDRGEWSEDGQRRRRSGDATYSTTAFTDKLIEDFDAATQSEAPFFAVYAPTAPHWPLHSPPGWEDHRRGDYAAGFDELCEKRMRGARKAGVLPNGMRLECQKQERPWTELDENEKAIRERAMEVYASMTEHLDQQVGRLLDTLRSNGQLSNTWVFFLNDNGAQGGSLRPRAIGQMDINDYTNTADNIGQRDSWANIGAGWADAITAPFRDGKASQYEGGIRTPAFVWHSDADDGIGRRYEHLLTVMDVMPTILELAGVPAPDGRFQGRDILPMRGKSFADALRGNGNAIHNNELIALDSAGRSVVFHDQYKLVRTLYGEWEMYNWTSDPGETNNIVNTYPGVAARLIEGFETAAKTRNYRRRPPRD